MGNGEDRRLLIDGIVTRLCAAAWSPILVAIAVYLRQLAANRNRTGGTDRHGCASR